jgi:hypothetical protein
MGNKLLLEKEAELGANEEAEAEEKLDAEAGASENGKSEEEEEREEEEAGWRAVAMPTKERRVAASNSRHAVH